MSKEQKKPRGWRLWATFLVPLAFAAAAGLYQTPLTGLAGEDATVRTVLRMDAAGEWEPAAADEALDELVAQMRCRRSDRRSHPDPAESGDLSIAYGDYTIVLTPTDAYACQTKADGTGGCYTITGADGKWYDQASALVQ